MLPAVALCLGLSCRLSHLLVVSYPHKFWVFMQARNLASGVARLLTQTFLALLLPATCLPAWLLVHHPMSLSAVHMRTHFFAAILTLIFLHSDFEAAPAQKQKSTSHKAAVATDKKRRKGAEQEPDSKSPQKQSYKKQKTEAAAGVSAAAGSSGKAVKGVTGMTGCTWRGCTADLVSLLHLFKMWDRFCRTLCFPCVQDLQAGGKECNNGWP